MGSDFITVSGVSVCYGRTVALADVSFSLASGGVCALLGPNGAGKSTLIHTLINLRQPSKGTLQLLGHDSRGLRHNDFENIGYVSSDQRLPEWMTVGDFLRFLSHLYPGWDAGLENSLMLFFDLPQQKRIRELSRGMRARLVLTSALAFRPKVLILDEPFSGLDSLVRDDLRERAFTIAQPESILITTHDIEDIDGLATEILYLNQGQLMLHESVVSLRSRYRQVAHPPQSSPNLSMVPSWMQMRSGGRDLTVESRYSDQTFPARAAAAFGQPDSVEPKMMSLREIVRSAANHVSARAR